MNKIFSWLYKVSYRVYYFPHHGQTLFTFRVRRSRGELYIGHARLCVCLCVPHRVPTLLKVPGCNLGEW